MEKKHLNVLFPQWQGNTEKSPFFGAAEFKLLYLAGQQIAEVGVNDFEDLPLEAGITGRADILRQLRAAFSFVEQKRPETLFFVGGGCDAGVVPASYLNNVYNGDLAFIWFDAHADLNTPETSPSGMFCGMPLRALMGEGDREIVEVLPRPFNPSQLVLAGVRTTDRAEAEFIARHSIPLIDVQTLKNGPEKLVQAVRGTGHKNIFIHIDFDVLDPEDFPNTRFPEPDGISPRALLNAVRALNSEFSLKGLGVYEYAESSGERRAWIEELVNIGISL